MKLIHEVNPTGLGLPPAIERRRYELKALLQSLLVRDFPDEIVVVPVPGQEDVVTLYYRPHDRDACHAVISELEDDARSFVRLQLDLATSGGTESGPRVSWERERREGRRQGVPAPASRSEAGDPRQLVRLGREALEGPTTSSALRLVSRRPSAARMGVPQRRSRFWSSSSINWRRTQPPWSTRRGCHRRRSATSACARCSPSPPRTSET